MKKKDAIEKFCPFSLNVETETDYTRCMTTKCMGWVIDQNIDDNDSFGHCELIYKRER